MADDTEQNEPIKTATDLELEKLASRLDALENENRELRQANQGLWSQLHPVGEVQEVQPAQPAENTAFNVLADKLGIKE